MFVQQSGQAWFVGGIWLWNWVRVRNAIVIMIMQRRFDLKGQNACVLFLWKRKTKKHQGKKNTWSATQRPRCMTHTRVGSVWGCHEKHYDFWYSGSWIHNISHGPVDSCWDWHGHYTCASLSRCVASERLQLDMWRRSDLWCIQYHKFELMLPWRATCLCPVSRHGNRVNQSEWAEKFNNVEFLHLWQQPGGL